MAMLWTMLVKGVAVLLVAVAVVRMLRSASASLRHGVWVAALAALLAVPVLDALGPVWEVGVVPHRHAVSGNRIAVDAVPPSRVGRGIAADTEGFATRSLEARPFAVIRLSDWVAMLVAVWACGVLIVALAWLRSFVLARRLIREAEPVTDSVWLGYARDATTRSGLRRAPLLLRSDALRVPIAWGFGRSAVVLPPQSADWDASRCVAVLLHEMAHLRRRDAWTQVLAQGALALHWPNPLAWFAYRRLLESREQACDDAVLREGAPAATYAAHLVAVARELGPARPPVAALAPMTGRSALETRIRSILDDEQHRERIGAYRWAATLAMTVALGIPLAALRPVAEAPCDDPPVASVPALLVVPADSLSLTSANVPDAVAPVAVTDATSPPRLAASEARPQVRRAARAISESIPTLRDTSRRSGSVALVTTEVPGEALENELDPEIWTAVADELGEAFELSDFVRRYAALYQERYPDRRVEIEYAADEAVPPPSRWGRYEHRYEHRYVPIATSASGARTRSSTVGTASDAFPALVANR